MEDDTGGGATTPDVTCVYHSKIRGYHIYKEIWTATIGETLSCRRETDNLMDPYVVAAIPHSAARLPILAFSSAVNCAYGPRVLVVCEIACFTPSFAAMILSSGY